MSKRLNITLDNKLVSDMDSFADERGLSRSGLIAVSVRDYMDAVKTLPGVRQQLNDLQLQLASLDTPKRPRKNS